MKKVQIMGISLILMLILLGACAPEAAPTVAPAQAPAPAAAAALAAPAKPAWQEKWEKVLEAAKKEGTVWIYSGGGGLFRIKVVDAVTKTYPLKVEFISAPTGQLVPRILTERQAGLYTVDVWMGGSGTPLAELIPRGVFEPLEPVLILPDVTDAELIKKIWWQGKLSWIDKNHRFLSFIGDTKNPFTINTDLVKPGEIKSYRDLLNPKWKGKISLRDPTVSGGGAKWFAMSIISGAIDLDYMRQLAKQEPYVIRDSRLQVDWLARGKYAIGIACDSISVQEFRNVGAPLEMLMPVEGTYISASFGNVAFVNKAPHPNAASTFINWLLTKEGQTVSARSLGGQSRREDVPTDHLLPSMIRQPGAKLLDTEVEELSQEDVRIRKEGLAKEIFGIK